MKFTKKFVPFVLTFVFIFSTPQFVLGASNVLPSADIGVLAADATVVSSVQPHLERVIKFKRSAVERGESNVGNFAIQFHGTARGGPVFVPQEAYAAAEGAEFGVMYRVIRGDHVLDPSEYTVRSISVESGAPEEEGFYRVGKGVTRQFTTRAQIEVQESGQYRFEIDRIIAKDINGNQVYFDITRQFTPFVTLVAADDESGNETGDTSEDGTTNDGETDADDAQGETATNPERSVYLTAKNIRTSAKNPSRREKDVARFVITFDATARGGDVYVPSHPVFYDDVEDYGMFLRVIKDGKPVANDAYVVRSAKITSGAPMSGVFYKAGEFYKLAKNTTRRFRIEVEIIGLSDGKYSLDHDYLKIQDSDGNTWTEDVLRQTTKAVKLETSDEQVSELFQITAPLGGEVWEKYTQHTIDWVPGDLTLDDVNAYLERKVRNRFEVVGKIDELAKGSIIWDGELENRGFDYPEGQYYIRLVNTKTDESSRTARPITIRNSNRALNVRLGMYTPGIEVKTERIPGDDGQTIYRQSYKTDGDTVTLWWNSQGAESCSIIVSDEVYFDDLPASGTKEIQVTGEAPYTSYFSDEAYGVDVNCYRDTVRDGRVQGNDFAYLDINASVLSDSENPNDDTQNNDATNDQATTLTTNESVSNSTTIVDSGEQDPYGVYELVMRITANQSDVYVPDSVAINDETGASGTFAADTGAAGFVYDITGPDTLSGTADAFINAVSNAVRVGNSFKVTTGETAAFVVRVLLNPDSDASNGPFGVQLQQVRFSSSADGVLMTQDVPDENKYRTQQVIIR